MTNHLLNKNNESDLPSHTCDLDLAEKFVDYLSQKFKNICQSFISTKNITRPTCVN